MAHLLIIDDDAAIRTDLCQALREHGHHVTAAPTALSGLQLAVAERPDLVVLSMGLPNVNGLEMLRMVRSICRVPVIIATAHDDEEEMLRGMEAGANDFVVKPFDAAQLDARLRAVLRRCRTNVAPTAVEVGPLQLNASTRKATLSGEQLELTPREFDLLYFLAARAGRVVTKRELLTEVWQLPYGGADKTVDVHLSWLRRKLGETAQQPRYLHTVRRVGVKLVAPETFSERCPAPAQGGSGPWF